MNRPVSKFTAIATIILTCGAIALLVVAWTVRASRQTGAGVSTPGIGQTKKSTPQAAGTILGKEATVSILPQQVLNLSRQNYGRLAPQPRYAITKTVIKYRSYAPDGSPLVVYARVYQPSAAGKYPVLAFAPGTTGMGDSCAASLEQPAKANWANYDSHMATYAGQGYAVVVTDYEGMRDAARLHHYMVGQLEGRAVLDSVRALKNFDTAAKNLYINDVFVAGYSQGGHAAFWADQINSAYAPDVKIKGVIGFGPVMDVGETWADIVRGATLDWFGPYVLTSYADYYHEGYSLDSILQPKWATHMATDVTTHCIDTAPRFWGRNPAAVYTSQFVAVMQQGTLSTNYPALWRRLIENQVNDHDTSSAKLINSGSRDDVVLPAQQQAARARLCVSPRGPLHWHEYEGATHYNTMVLSLQDTLSWMKAVMNGDSVPNDCD